MMALTNSKPEWDRLRTRVLSQAVDENGCRIMISMIEDAEMIKMYPDMIKTMCNEVVCHIPRLIVHPFANLFVLKLIEVCSVEQYLLIFIRVIMDSTVLVFICYDSYGTKVVQNLLEKLRHYLRLYQTDLANLNFLHSRVVGFLDVLSPGIVGLITDMNAHHIVQYCLKNFPADCNEILFYEVIYNTLAIAKDQFGCCVLKQCVDNSEGKIRSSLLSNIITHAPELAVDPFGNHIVQHMLELDEGLDIMQKLKGSFVELSSNKFGSQVVKKCLTTTQQANLVIQELLCSQIISSLMVHPYGKSVTMAALSASRFAQVNYYEYMKLRVTSVLQSMKNDIDCLDMFEWFEKNDQKV